jgi:hypothetical protein
MATLSRRRALASLGLLGGSALLSGCGSRSPAAQGSPPQPETQPTANKRAASPDASATSASAANAPSATLTTGSWTYRPLDPRGVAQRAYDMYPQGSCMYAVFGSVIAQLADEMGGPFAAFPLGMMRYGTTGVGGWGSLCGVVNGCAALIGLFHPEQTDGRRDELISDLCLWYESAALPQFAPAGTESESPLVTSESGSILCHVSVSQWCRVADCDAYSTKRRERCRRLSADGARKVVELLNGDAHRSGDFVDFPTHTQSCMDCHGKDGHGNSMTRMSCGSCHQFDSKHP